MTETARRGVFLIGAIGVGAVLLWGVFELPPFGDYDGRYGSLLTDVAVRERHAVNVVTAVVFDYRGFDTLGEEFILFGSVVSVALLLRAHREEEEAPPRDQSPERDAPQDSDLVRELCLAFVAPTLLFGLYVVAHGHLTPGGGFQGGVVLATAPLFMYLGGLYEGLRKVSPEWLVEAGESVGAASYVIIGALGLLLGTAFLNNWLPLGAPKDLASSGTIAVINAGVGVAVAAGFVLLLTEFLEQTLEIRRRAKTL